MMNRGKCEALIKTVYLEVFTEQLGFYSQATQKRIGEEALPTS